MRNVNTVIFDIGRVLVGIHTSGPKFRRLMQDIGVPPDEVFNKAWFSNEISSFMTGRVDAPEFHRMIMEQFGLSYSFDEFAEAWCDMFTPMPAMQALFHEVAMRYRLGLLSDTDPLHWQYLLRIMPWLGEVEKPTLSFEVGYLKPHPAMFSAAAANYGCAKDECLFIDDLIGNVDGARYCGMPALLFTGVDKLRRDLAGLMVL